MTGIQVCWRWRYKDSEDQIKITNSADNDIWHYFSFLVNMVKLSKGEENLWNLVKTARVDSFTDLTEKSLLCFLNRNKPMPRNNVIEEQLKFIEMSLGLVNTSHYPLGENITTEELETAGRMFVYLTNCPEKEYVAWLRLYQDLFENYDLRTIMANLARVRAAASQLGKTKELELATRLLEKISTLKQLKYQMINQLHSGETRGDNNGDELLGLVSLLQNVSNIEKVQTLSNHPVHMLEDDKMMSPSAFIPFCSFGGNMSALGARIDMINLPVCTSFQEQVFNDQLCYQIDVNKLNVAAGDRGLTFAIDINEDRQVQDLGAELVRGNFDENVLDAAIMRIEEHQKALIYIGSLGETNN